MSGDGIHPIRMWKRFLDDIFIIWTGTVENLHKFLDDLNNIHPTIKFTINHTKNENENNCNCPPCPSIPFLDTSAFVKDNKIILDLYKKPTDRCQYLLTSSCHPAHVTDNIPFSLAYRIVRICSESESRDNRLKELKELLVSRNYRPSLVDAAIDKARKIPRFMAIRKSQIITKQTTRPVLAITYDPRLPCIPKILKKHWRTMVTVDPHLAEIFPLPPLTAYRRPSNLKDKLIRSKIPENTSRPKRILPGMKKCGKSCSICPYISPTAVVKSSSSNYTHDIEAAVNCTSCNIIYCITCLHCNLQYIGETGNSLATRFGQHKGYVRNRMMEKATGSHFNLKGHCISDMQVVILEKIRSPDEAFRKEREKMFINMFNTGYRGLNKQK